MPNPIDVFRARCEARALLWQAGEFGDPDDPRSLHTAVDALVYPAVDASFALGSDAVQAIMAAAFEAVRDE